MCEKNKDLENESWKLSPKKTIRQILEGLKSEIIDLALSKGWVLDFAATKKFYLDYLSFMSKDDLIEMIMDLLRDCDIITALESEIENWAQDFIDNALEGEK